jgi:hypothetical protein
MKSQGKFVMKSRIATIRHFASCESQARVIVNGATDECFRPKEMIGSAQTLVELVQVGKWAFTHVTAASTPSRD